MDLAGHRLSAGRLQALAGETLRVALSNAHGGESVATWPGELRKLDGCWSSRSFGEVLSKKFFLLIGFF